MGCISRIWNETWLTGFFYKPCNYELFVKQSLNMEMAIVMARVWLTVLLQKSLFFSIFLNYGLVWSVICSSTQCSACWNEISGFWHGLDSSSWYRWIHPAGAREYSSRQLLLDVPGHVDMVIFPNYVSRICRFFLIV